MKQIYNKLVRDKIPNKIQESGRDCVTEILSDADYICMLDEKLDEEVDEYHQNHSLEELADLLEVIRAVILARRYSYNELEEIRFKKPQRRDGFKEKILLKGVIE